MALISEIAVVSDLSETRKSQMYELLCKYFTGVERKNFNRDLSEKDWVILLLDEETGEVKGFSTQKLLEIESGGVRVKGVFSGDTIVDKRHWNEMLLIKAWGDLAHSLIEKYKGCRLYWFLICMGYRTYRYLPVFFKEYYPRYDRETPDLEKAMIDAFAQSKFPAEYNRTLGIIRPFTKAVLRPGVSEIHDNLLKNPHISYFVNKNAGYLNGDELVCIAELSRENFKNIAHKFNKNLSQVSTGA
ncbi:MAG: hypothetical protein WC491_01065 [Candidatus Omnitrophota bacterium]